MERNEIRAAALNVVDACAVLAVLVWRWFANCFSTPRLILAALASGTVSFGATLAFLA